MDTTVKVLSIIIVNWNTRDLLKSCLGSIFQFPPEAAFEVIVVDNASTDGSAAMVEREFPAVRLIKNSVNKGHAGSNNQAINKSSGEYILLLNSDAIVLSGCLHRLLGIMSREARVEVLSAQSLNPDGTVQQGCRRFPTLKTALYYDTVLEWWFPFNTELRRYLYRDWPHDNFGEVEQPPLTCLLVKREIIRKIGLFDEHFFLFYSDPDWFLRMKNAGIKVYFTPEAKVLHYGRASVLLNPQANLYWHRDKLFFYKKHFGVLAACFVKSVGLLDCSVRIAKIIVKRIAGIAAAREEAETFQSFFSIVRA
jgi:GT2 family glycosyltransferase